METKRVDDLSETIPSQWSGGSSSPQSQSKLSSILHWDTLQTEQKNNRLATYRMSSPKLKVPILMSTLQICFFFSMEETLEIEWIWSVFWDRTKDFEENLTNFSKHIDLKKARPRVHKEIQSTPYSVLNFLNEIAAVKRLQSYDSPLG